MKRQLNKNKRKIRKRQQVSKRQEVPKPQLSFRNSRYQLANKISAIQVSIMHQTAEVRKKCVKQSKNDNEYPARQGLLIRPKN